MNAEGESFRREPGTRGGVAVARERRPSISDFSLLRLIGRGSYGDVWLARSLTGIYRAIKVIYRDRFADAAPFEREFNGLKRFTAVALPESGHLALLHVGQNEAEGYFYYVMELADDVHTGRDVDPDRYRPLTLKELGGMRARLPAGGCVPIAVELTRALAALHRRGLVHRDIKPSNVILVGGQPKLADIGLVTSSTEARTFVGTEGYVPPEGPGKPSADVFALGKVIYELSTGLAREDFPRLPEGLRERPDREAIIELNEVVLAACDPVESRRYPDAAAMLADLLELEAGHSLRRRKARARLARYAAAAALLAVVGLGLTWWRLRPPRSVAPSAAQQLVAQAWALMDRPDWSREDLEFADGLCRRACTLDPLDADAWAAWSQVNTLYCSAVIDTSPARREAARSDAERALRLAPNSTAARLAEACYLAHLELPAFAPEARRMLRQLLAENPDDPRALREFAWEERVMGRPHQAVIALNRLARNPLFAAQAWLRLGDLADERGDNDAYLQAIDRSIAAHPFADNLSSKLDLLTNWFGDLGAAEALIKGIPASLAQSDALLSQVFRVYYFQREPDRALDFLKGIPRDWLAGGDGGPLGYFKGQAYQMSGRPDLARIEWQGALRLVDSRLAADPTSAHLLAVKVRLLIFLGELAEAERNLPVIAEARKDGDWTGAFLLKVAQGQLDAAMDIFERKVVRYFGNAAQLRLDPQFDPLRANARFKAELARAEGDPKRSPRARAGNVPSLAAAN